MSRKKSNVPRKRGHLTLPDASIKRIAEIRKKSGAESDAEVVRRAIRLYERLLKDVETINASRK